MTFHSMTFQAWKMKSLNFMTFQVFCDMYKPCYIWGFSTKFIMFWPFGNTLYMQWIFFPLRKLLAVLGEKWRLIFCVCSLDKLTVTVRFVPWKQYPTKADVWHITIIWQTTEQFLTNNKWLDSNVNKLTGIILTCLSYNTWPRDLRDAWLICKLLTCWLTWSNNACLTELDMYRVVCLLKMVFLISILMQHTHWLQLTNWK